MPITHTFQSDKADPLDGTIIGKTKWNDDHTVENLLVESDGVTLQNAILGSPSDTSIKVSHYFEGADPGSHATTQHALIGLHIEPVGSGLNGPNTADWAMTLSTLKEDFQTSAVDGQIGIGNLVVRQGSVGDADAFDINVAGYGTAFYAAYEALTTRFNASDVVLEQVDVQTCVVHEAGVGAMGYFASKIVGTAGDAFRADASSGQSWANFFQFLSNGGLISKLDFDGVQYLKGALLLNTESLLGADDNLDIVQRDGGIAIRIKRGTDSSPTGHFMECVNTALNADRFVVTAAEPSSGNTNMILAYHNGSAVVAQTVTLGDPNSGGSGFKLLRVPN